MTAPVSPEAGPEPRPSRRTIFWGRSVPQAVAKAALQHGVAVERLAYRIHPKRHGFVKQPRAFLIEVDLAALERAAVPLSTAPELAHDSAAAPVVPAAVPAGQPLRGLSPPHSLRPAAKAASEESWDLPDADSELAAGEAIDRLLRFAGVEAATTVRSVGDRLEIELRGAEASTAATDGADWPEALEQLLPRAIVTLSGRRVRCVVDLDGRRAAREAELRRLALECAERVRKGGQAELLEPLPAAERRLVHMALAEAGDLSTESLGSGFEKRIQIALRATD